MKRFLIGVGAMLALAAPGLAHAESDCATLKTTALDHAQVTSATLDTGGKISLCRLQITSRPTPDSDIRIELWIPMGEAWNGKFLQLGNGGFAGSINSMMIRSYATRGYAVAGTDNGHQSKVGTSAVWALGHPQKVVDYGWRAVKETTDVSKTLIAAQKGGGPKRSYFSGCSDGGREALMSAQRFPGDFDGIVAGAPANYMSMLFGNAASQQQALARPGGYLAKPQLEILQSAVLKQCGGEAFIRDPAACRFDPRALACAKGRSDGCLTALQADTALRIYQGRVDPRTGKVAFPGVSPGSEALTGGWPAWITGASQARNSEAAGYQFGANAFKYFAFADPAFDFLKLDLGGGFEGAKAKMGPIVDSPSANLAAFRKHGGKLIQYHGWADAGIPARSTIRYYEDVRATMGNTSDFYRTYMIPGMLHCGGGPGPSNVDWLAVLDAWVGEAKAPGPLTATAAGNGSQLLCPYPGVAKSDGKGAWSCRVPKS